MSASSPPRRTHRRRSVLGRVKAVAVGLFVSAPRHLVLWFLGAPPALQIVVALIGLGGAGAGGYYLFHQLPKYKRFRAADEAWGRFTAAQGKMSEPDMRAALDDVLKHHPDNASALAWKAALDTGEAEPSDIGMIRHVVIGHLAAGRWQDADREAGKALAVNPHEWLAHFTRAHEAMTRDDKADAAKHLDDMTAAMAHKEGQPYPPMLPMAIALYHRVGRDPKDLRAFVQNAVVPYLRSAPAQQLGAGGKAVLVECYLEGYESSLDRPQPAPLVQGWAAAARLADDAAADAVRDGDLPTLRRVGRLAQPLAFRLAYLLKHEQVKPQQAAELSRDLEARTRRVWQAVLEKDPKAADAYLGLADSYFRTNDPRAAIEWVNTGLAAAPGDIRLAQAASQINQKHGNAALAYAQARRAAEKEPGNPARWYIAADAAAAAGRLDLALEACQQVRAIAPTDPGAILTEARLRLEGGDAFAAARLFQEAGTDVLARNPTLTRAYVRALVESGNEAQLPDFLAKVEAIGAEAKSPGPVTAALRGWADAAPAADPKVSAKRAAAIADKLAGLLRGPYPDNLDLLRLYADVRFRWAEFGDPPWEPVRTQEAVSAYDRVRVKLPDDKEVATALGWLELFARQKPDAALRAVAPLAAPGAEPGLTFPQVELLGAVYRANGRADDAVRVLARVAGSAQVTPGCLIQLSRAYFARGDRDQAAAALNRARALPIGTREQPEFAAAARDLAK